MENYSYSSYPESGDSSPRSREVEFENSPWDDQSQQQVSKVKFMCSYGGKIHPRSHDNQLSYIGGETKILSVDRNIKFASLISKLSAICDADTGSVSFKYQLPGEDLDALISVTCGDDLEHMMHEYDRLVRASGKPARLRLFLFPLNPAAAAAGQSFGSVEGKTEKERFVEALNSGPIQPSQPPSTLPPSNNVDFLFGLEKGMAPQAPGLAVKVRDPSLDSAVYEPEIQVPAVDDRSIGLDAIHKHIQDLQRLRLAEEQCMYRRKSDDNLSGGYTGEYYAQKGPDKVAPTNFPGTVPGAGPVPSGYWQDKQFPGGVFQGSTLGPNQPVYVISAPSPAGMYHSPAPPVGRPVTGPGGQGYYAVQRMPPEVYREQPVYNVMPPVPPSAVAPPTLPPQTLPITSGSVRVADAGFTQVAYDNSGMGRQVFYTAAGGVMAPPQGPVPQYQQIPAAVNSDMRPAVTLNQDGGKVVAAKVSQTLV